MEHTEIDLIEASADAFLYELREKTYNHYAGFSKTYDLEKVYQSHKDLLSRKGIDRVLKVYRNTGNRRAQYLSKFMVDSYLSEGVKKIDAEISEAESAGTLNFKGEKVRYRSILGKLFNTDNTVERHMLDAHRRQFSGRFNGKRLKRIKSLNEHSISLGYDGYTDLCEELKDIQLSVYQDECLLFLKNTKDRYVEELSYYARKNDLSPNHLERSDLFLIARAGQYDPIFKGETLLENMASTLHNLGIDMHQQERIHIDTEEREGKAARPFCIAVEAPGDVRMVIRKSGGREDYIKFFHEMGHAQHWAHVDDSLPFTFKHLGDYGVTEGYAFLFQSLISNPLWIENHTGMVNRDERDAYIRLSDFLNLYLMRRYATKLVYEYELFENKAPENMGQRYADLFTDHMGITYWPEDYLSDVDAGFYTVNYLRAWMMEYHLTHHLEEKIGRNWFMCPDAGTLLAGLWRKGQTDDVDEIIRSLNRGSPRFSELSADFRSGSPASRTR